MKKKKMEPLILPEGVAYRMTLEAKTETDILKLASDIHYQLRSNREYVENNIILNVRRDSVVLDIMDECSEVPSVLIFE